MSSAARQRKDEEINISAAALEQIIHFVLYGSLERGDQKLHKFHKQIPALTAEIVQRALSWKEL